MKTLSADAIDPQFLEAIRARADAGEPKAMFDLGRLYDIPEKPGVALDLETARTWYERSAQAGFAWAQFALGNMLEHAQGGPRNDLGARRWYEASAAQGIAEAQMHLASMLKAGRGGPKDTAGAVEWYGRAAAQGHELAATNLALMHLEGSVEQPDVPEARRLLEFAADKLDGLAHLVLGDLHLRGIGDKAHGGLALVHFCVAVLLLRPGPDAERAREMKETLLARQPALREEYENHARGFVAERTVAQKEGEARAVLRPSDDTHAT
jgi:TPR repeat protein